MSESRLKRCYEKLSSRQRRRREEEEKRRRLSGDDSEDDYEIENDENVRGCSCECGGGFAKKRDMEEEEKMGKMISFDVRNYRHKLVVAKRRRTTKRIIDSMNGGQHDQQVVEEVEECMVFVEEKQSLLFKAIDFY